MVPGEPLTVDLESLRQVADESRSTWQQVSTSGSQIGDRLPLPNPCDESSAQCLEGAHGEQVTSDRYDEIVTVEENNPVQWPDVGASVVEDKVRVDLCCNSVDQGA